MPNWTYVNLPFQPYTYSNQVFVKAKSTFRTVGKHNDPDSMRQAYFVELLRCLARTLGSNRVPVFINFMGERRRMDRGCIGHALAAGILRTLQLGYGDFVDYVVLAD